MTKQQQHTTSKLLSWVLRHEPHAIGLTLDPNGWADTAELLERLRLQGHAITQEDLETVVRNNDKKRFAFSEDRTRIRALQGHSTQVDLQLPEQTPPDTLYHGTARQNLDSIREKGLLKGQRHHVHLSYEPATAQQVGQRYGVPIVLEIRAQHMYADGLKCYRTDNGVWLTEHVPPSYIVWES